MRENVLFLPDFTTIIQFELEETVNFIFLTFAVFNS